MKTEPTLKQVDLAKLVECNHIHLNAVLNGRVQGSLKLCLAIEQKTHGAIKALDLRPDLKELLYPSNKSGEGAERPNNPPG